jgi:hypothetical protein
LTGLGRNQRSHNIFINFFIVSFLFSAEKYSVHQLRTPFIVLPTLHCVVVSITGFHLQAMQPRSHFPVLSSEKDFAQRMTIRR